MIKLTIESIMSPNMQIRNDRKNDFLEPQLEHMEKFQLGKRYPDFDILEPFIEEYDVDLNTLKLGDIVIKDWQYGHLENTGYRPCMVVGESDGSCIKVKGSGNNIYNVCTDPSLTRGQIYHKLYKDKLYGGDDE